MPLLQPEGKGLTPKGKNDATCDRVNVNSMSTRLTQSLPADQDSGWISDKEAAGSIQLLFRIFRLALILDRIQRTAGRANSRLLA